MKVPQQQGVPIVSHEIGRWLELYVRTGLFGSTVEGAAAALLSERIRADVASGALFKLLARSP